MIWSLSVGSGVRAQTRSGKRRSAFDVRLLTQNVPATSQPAATREEWQSLRTSPPLWSTATSGSLS